jgi:hypothetical protein
MTNSELEQRKTRAVNETLVIAPTEGGFRVYNPANITHLYMVSGIPELPKCNCPDFETHQSDPEWRCKHIFAVLNQMVKHQGPKPATESPQVPERKESALTASEPTEKKKSRGPRNGHSQMLIKRSISPDGYIDSLSVEFMTPVDSGAVEAVKEYAQKILKLQSEIAEEFLKANGNGNMRNHALGKNNGKGPANSNAESSTEGDARSPSQQEAKGANGSADNAVPAQLLNIAGMDTKAGWTTFINVQVNGITAKLFGDKQELAKHITDAGFAGVADRMTQGMLLNLPCRVITKRSQDGKYLNIEKVLPAKPLEGNGRAGK